MQEKDVIEILCDFISTKFPKECKSCGRRFNSLAEYLRNTTHTGKPISYDVEDGNWKPQKPVGTISFANCPCGTTLAIGSEGMSIFTLWKLMNWARKETKNRNIELSDLLEDLRTKIDKKVLTDANH